MIIRRDDEFIEYIVDKYSDLLKRVAYQNLKIKSEAEDVVQDTLIALLNEEVFSDEEHLKAWLIRVAINKAKNRNKLAWVRRDIEYKDYHGDVDKEDLGVWELLDSLDSKYKNVIYLYYYEGYTIKEISKILNKKQNTINSQLTRARKKLKVILEEEHEQSI